MAGADFEGFYRANYARLVGQMVAVVGDVHEAEDVVQEAFARASLHWSRVRGYHAPEAWVRRVALNYAFSGLRRARYRRRAVERLAQPEEAVPAAGAEVVDMVAALRRLPPRQREVLVLYYVVELPVEEIGRHLRLPVGTVKSRLARGRTALARLLGADAAERRPRMRDEELRRRMEQVAEYGERVVSPPDPALLYRRARRRVARLAALGVLLACALAGGGLAVRTTLAGDERYPAVTLPPGPATTAVPPTTAPPGTTSPPTTAPAAAPARFPAAPPMIGDFNATVPAAQLVTRDSGWALTTDRLAWTGDGGRSWRTITPGKVPAAQVRGAFFLDPRTGWVVTSARRRETGSRVQLAVYRTRDAGATWQRSSLGQLDLGGDNAAGGYEGGFGVLALPSFVDQRHGWVAVRTSSDTYEAHSFLFRTTDGGATWDRLPPPPGAPRLAFSSRTTGWSVVQGGGGLYRTVDAGRGWRKVAFAPPPALRGTRVALREPPTFKSQRDGFLPVEFLGPERGPTRVLAAGFYVTADGGATWTPRYVPLAEEDEEHGLLPLAAADRTTMVALVGHEARKLLTSRDGGRRWVVGGTGLEGRYPAVRGVAFADPGTGWAVTGRGTSLPNGCYPQTPRCDDRGVLLRTTDGGTSWSEATPGR